jgi:hypothetical protein
MRRAAALAAAVLLVTGCGKRDSDPGPGGVTVGEARALDEAAAMLDKQRPPADALKPGTSTSAPKASATPAK